MVMPIGGGIGLATRRDGAPDSPSVADSYWNDVIGGAAQQAWGEYGPKLKALLLGKLGQGDLITAGVTLYNLVVEIGDTSETVERDDNGDLIVHLMTSAYLEATSTTPTVLGSYADPRLSFACGLDITYRIDLPPINQPLQASGFESIRVLSPVIDSHNAPADLAFVFDAIIDFFSGLDFAGILEAFIASTDFAPYANDALGPLNDRLTALANEGYWFLDAVVDVLDGQSTALHSLSLPGAPAGVLDLLLTTYGFDRSGSIEGTISWPKTLGAPTTLPKLSSQMALRQDTAALQMLGATSMALQSERSATWTAITRTAAVADAPAAAAAHAGVAGTVEDDAAPFAAAAATSIAQTLAAMPPADRVVAAQEMKSGMASRFISLIGGADRFAELRTEFIRGREDFVVPVTVSVSGGTGQFAEQRAVGTLASLWADDDDTTYRRQFVLVDIPIDAGLSVTCTMAPKYRWDGSTDSVACQPAGWAGSVTVHPAPKISFAQAMADQVEVQLPDRTRVFGSTDQLAKSGIIFVGGITSGEEKVALNPQPIPPGDEAIAEVHATRIGALGGASTTSFKLSTTQSVSQSATQSVTAAAAQVAAQPVAEQVSHAVSQTVSQETPAQLVRDNRFGSTTARVQDHGAVIAAAAYIRENPAGDGTVRGIDFRVVEHHEQVIR